MDFAIFASGPSLTQEDCERFRGWETICINSTFRLTPWADLLYACDEWWWDQNIADVNVGFHGERWTQSAEAARKYGLGYIRSERKPGLGRECIHQGANSGYQAINLAYLRGATRIVLLGFDMNKHRGRTHWHDPHRVGDSHPYDLWRELMAPLAEDLKAAGVEVLNASRRTDLTCFPRVNASDLSPA